MKRTSKKVAIILIILFLTILFAITQGEHLVTNIVYGIMKLNQKEKELPASGRYVCDEIGLTIVFAEDGDFAITGDGTVYEINVDYGGKMYFRNNNANIAVASYHWRESDNILSLKFSETQFDWTVSKNYLFTLRIN